MDRVRVIPVCVFVSLQSGKKKGVKVLKDEPLGECMCMHAHRFFHIHIMHTHIHIMHARAHTHTHTHTK